MVVCHALWWSQLDRRKLGSYLMRKSFTKAPSWSLVKATLSSWVSLTSGSLEAAHKEKSFTEIPSWSLAFPLNHKLIFHSRVSLVYGSMCSLLVLSYYKCLLRLNSDIAKPSPVFQCPRKSLSRPWAWNSVRMLPIQ